METPLREVKKRLDEIAEQAQFAKLMPVGIIDTGKLTEIFMGTAEAYNRALTIVVDRISRDIGRLDDTKALEEVKGLVEQDIALLSKFQATMDEIRAIYVKLGENAPLEKEVLEQLREKLRSQ